MNGLISMCSSAFHEGKCHLTLLGSSEKSAILFEAEVDLNEISTSQKLHDHTAAGDKSRFSTIGIAEARRLESWQKNLRCDDGSNTEFHQRSPIRGEDHTHPVERIYRGIRRRDSVHWTVEYGHHRSPSNTPDESEETIPKSGI